MSVPLERSREKGGALTHASQPHAIVIYRHPHPDYGAPEKYGSCVGRDFKHRRSRMAKASTTAGEFGHGQGWHFTMIWLVAANSITHMPYCVFSGRLVREIVSSRKKPKFCVILLDLWMHLRLKHVSSVV